VIASLIALG
jgi:hypothetical protein